MAYVVIVSFEVVILVDTIHKSWCYKVYFSCSENV